MKTKYGIPQIQLDRIFARDTVCVYCRKTMVFPYDVKNSSNSATIEHLNHRAHWDSVMDFISQGKDVQSIIAICCGACNSSRGDKSLREWFNSRYCIDKDISLLTISSVVKDYVKLYEVVDIK